MGLSGSGRCDGRPLDPSSVYTGARRRGIGRNVGAPPRRGEAGMIQARKLGHVVLKVRDVEKSKEFYTRVLGLKVAYDQKEWGAVVLSGGEQHHGLALLQLATG